LPSKEFIEERRRDLEIHLQEIETELENVAEKSDDDHWKPKFVRRGNDVAEIGNIGADWSAESAEDQASFEVNLGVMLILLEDRNKVRDALKKIDEGSYGWCENCRQYINEERLKVYPEADVCIECDNG